MFEVQSMQGIAYDINEQQQLDWTTDSERNKSQQNYNHQMYRNLSKYFIFTGSVLMLIFLIKSLTSQHVPIEQALPVESENVKQTKRYLQQNKVRNVYQIKNTDLSLSTLDHPINTYHNHQDFSLSYQSLGMPQLGQSFNQQPILFQNYLAFELREEQLFKPYGNTDCEFQSYGSQSDKSVLCKNIIPHSLAILQFGLDNQNRLACSLSDRFKLKSTYYSCGCPRSNACNSPLSDYQQVCLSQIVQISKQNVFTTLKNEIDKKGLAGKHIILKIDVGGAQWMALKTLPLEYLTYIDQLIIKFHNPKYPHLMLPLKGYQNIIKVLKQSFASVNLHLDNNECVGEYENSRDYRRFKSTAMEVTLINRRLLKIMDDSRLYLTNFKNTVTSILKPDCQMNDNN